MGNTRWVRVTQRDRDTDRQTDIRLTACFPGQPG